MITDADRVVQTLLNLLGNAVKFSPPGGEVTVCSLVRADTVEFRIDDQGRGIPEDMLESIFTRFEQVDSSDAREKGGTGLGLAISRSLVERLGGRIWAENQPRRSAVQLRAAAGDPAGRSARRRAAARSGDVRTAGRNATGRTRLRSKRDRPGNVALLAGVRPAINGEQSGAAPALEDDNKR